MPDRFTLFGLSDPFRVMELTHDRKDVKRGSQAGVFDVYELKPQPAGSKSKDCPKSASHRWSLHLPSAVYGNVMSPRVQRVLGLPGLPLRYLLIGEYMEWEPGSHALILLSGGHPRSFGKCFSAILEADSSRTTNVLPLMPQGAFDADLEDVCVSRDGVVHALLMMTDRSKPDWGFDGYRLATLTPARWITRKLDPNMDLFTVRLASGGTRVFLVWSEGAYAEGDEADSRVYLAPVTAEGVRPKVHVGSGGQYRICLLAVSPSGDAYVVRSNPQPDLSIADLTSGDRPVCMPLIYHLSVFDGRTLARRADATLMWPTGADFMPLAMAVDSQDDVHLIADLPCGERKYRHDGRYYYKYVPHYGRIKAEAWKQAGGFRPGPQGKDGE